jgi:transcription elongation factor GreA
MEGWKQFKGIGDACARQRPPSISFGAVILPPRTETTLKRDLKEIEMDKIPMTAQGHTVLEQELKRLQQIERPRIIQAISEARTHGDLAENAEYFAAKEAQSLNEGRIAELEDKLSRAEVIDVSKLSGSTVMFGATVTLVDEDTDEKKVYQIVGEAEADVKAGRVSISSPTARALIGKKVGDTVEVNTPGGGKSYEILKVAFG